MGAAPSDDDWPFPGECVSGMLVDQHDGQGGKFLVDGDRAYSGRADRMNRRTAREERKEDPDKSTNSDERLPPARQSGDERLGAKAGSIRHTTSS